MFVAQPQSLSKPSKAKWLFAIALLITGALTIVILARTPSSTSDTTLVIGKDNTATVTGPVLDNIKKCTVDLTCYLKMKFQDADVHVVYVTSEGKPCVNEQAAQQGFGVKKGDRVEAQGQYRKEGQLHIISTCPSNAFYIKVLPASGRIE